MEREHHSRACLLAIALLLALAAALVLARPADAGSYVVTECSSVSAAAPGVTWERSSEHYRERALCGSDQGLQAYHEADGSPQWHYGGWVWRAPPGAVFTSVQANASLTHQAGHRGELVATRTSGEPVEFGAEHNDFRVHAVSGEFSQFHSWLRCVGAQTCGRAAGDAAHAYVRGVYLRTDDRAAPVVRLAGGTLLDGSVIRGVRSLSFQATDAGGGIRAVSVEANGSPLFVDVRNCALAAGFATALSPCPSATGELAVVPTASSAFVTGPNTVAACVEDLALDGNPNRTCAPATVWADNACPGSSVSGGRTLEAGFAGAGDRVTVRSVRRPVISGRLAGAGAGATICALTRDDLPGAPVVVAATAATRQDGGFELELPAGPSREVFVHHVVGDEVLARHGLRLRSVVRPALEVRPRAGLRNRDRLRFTGRLPGPACGNRVVKVQARIGRRRWQVFRTARSDESCAIAARYRLRATEGARRYRFRALVPQQGGYPYERGYSATVRVKVARR